MILIKLVCIILIILILSIIIYLIRQIVQKNKAIYELRSLGKKYMNVESSKEDINEWNKYMPALEGEYLVNSIHMESLYCAIKEIFNKYLLYYYPDNYRVNYLGEDKGQAQKNNYRELLLITLNEVQFIINKEAYGEKEYYEILSLFKKVISSDSKIYVSERKDSRELKELMVLVAEIKKYVHQNTNEEIEWHIKINKLLKEDLSFL